MSSMEVKIKTLQGAVYSITVPEGGNTLVRDFKTMAEAESHIPVDEIKLLYHGKVMADEKSLKDYNVESGCTILVMKKPPAPAQPQPQPQAAQPQQQTSAQASQPGGQPVLPNLFPPSSPAGDTLNTILQQAFQQAFRTGSGVNVNVSLNTGVPAQPAGSAGADGQANAQQPGQRGPSQMQVRVMPITQDMQALMRDAYAQVSGVPVVQQGGQSGQGQPQQQQQQAQAQPLNILQQVLQSLSGARNAVERDSDLIDADDDDRAASEAASSLFTNMLRDLSGEVDSNPNTNVNDFLQREFDRLRGTSDYSDSDSESDDEANNGRGTLLDHLSREIFSRMTIQELIGLSSHSEQSNIKLVSATREALIKEIGAGDHPTQEDVDAYSAKVLEELVRSFNDESLPDEIRQRLRAGASLPDTFCNSVREPLRDVFRMLTSSDEPAQVFSRVVEWSHTSLVNIIDNLGAVLQGSVDDVAVILRYLVYTNSVNDVGSEMAFSVATMFSQNIMQRYHHFKAQMLEALRQSSSSGSGSASASSAVPQIDIPCDASVLNPMPPVRSLVEALLQRADHDDQTAVNIPLSDLYRSGSMSKHA